VTQKRDDESPKPEEPAGSERKERVVHTRVSAILEEELRRFADSLRVPVSNVIRTILEDALEAAGDKVETKLRKAAKQVGTERERLKKKLEKTALAGVYAYQAVTVAMPTDCAQCGKELEPGVAAHLGLTDVVGQKRLFVCEHCLPKR
jgi:hypothetical protein